jgi:hypothetical protein
MIFCYFLFTRRVHVRFKPEKNDTIAIWSKNLKKTISFFRCQVFPSIYKSMLTCCSCLCFLLIRTWQRINNIYRSIQSKYPRSMRSWHGKIINRCVLKPKLLWFFIQSETDGWKQTTTDGWSRLQGRSNLHD